MSTLIQRIEAYLDDPLRPVEFGIHLDLLREALQALKLRNAGLRKIIEFPVHSESVGCAMEMQHIARIAIQNDQLDNESNQALSHRCAWLIENGKVQGHGLKYQTFVPDTGMFTWTEDVYKALQFSRRVDAELIAKESEDAWKIVEHSFAASIERDLE